MRTASRVAALLVTVIAIALWFFSGPNYGWTKTSVRVTRLDPVTGLEEPIWEKRFLPGTDWLAVGLVTGTLLYAGSYCFRKKPEQRDTHLHERSEPKRPAL